MADQIDRTNDPRFATGRYIPAVRPRQKGERNKRTIAQEEFARRVLSGGKGEEGMKEYEDNVRMRLLAGILPPQIEALVLYYLYGKPVDRIELKDKSPALSHLTPEELHERALVVANTIAEARSEDETPVPSPEPPPMSDSPVH